MSQNSGNSGPDQGQLAAQQAQAAQAQQQQQNQWAAEQAQTNQANQATAQMTQQQLQQATSGQTQQAQNFQQGNIAQGAAQNATGGPNGIKAASTIANNTLALSPADQKLQAAGAATSDPNSLANLVKKRTLSQSNIIGTPGGNALASSNVNLGGT